MSRFFMPALAASLLAAVALTPASAQTAPAPSSPPVFCGGMGGGMGSWLTPEQRLMHFSEMQKATANMSFSQMSDYRYTMHQKIWNMSPAERQRFADDLTAKWNALTPEQKSALQNRMAACGYGRGMGHGWGRGRGMGGGGMGWGPGGW
jgi:Spy/CpxP family protein refolding chaperone